MTRLLELPQVFQRAWRSRAPKSPSRPRLRPSQPRGRNPPPADPRQTAARSPAGPVRKEEPARRPRGCVLPLRRGLRPGCRLQAGRCCTLRPSPRRQPRQPWLRPLSFSSTISSGKRKRKPPRGGPGPERAVSAERGLAARGGGLGAARGRPGGARTGTRSPREAGRQADGPARRGRSGLLPGLPCMER